MFTGIIEEIGVLLAANSQADGKRLTVGAKEILEDAEIGASISISGACTTIEKLTENSFSVFISKETLAKTTLGKMTSGDCVNIERAMRLSDRLGGHLVSGHVDGTGTIKSLSVQGSSPVLQIEHPRQFLHLCVEKGSIAIDGISLTIAAMNDTVIQISLIPHTFENTTLKYKKTGDTVNIEYDLIGKYIYRFTQTGKQMPGETLNKNMLKDSGFM